MLGTGFMGRTHSNAFNQVGHFFDLPYKLVLKTCYGRNQTTLDKFQKTWGYEETSTDWHKVIADPEIDVIDVATPNFLHKEMVIEAAKAGKMIICEKPLAMSYAEAEEMAARQRADAMSFLTSIFGCSYSAFLKKRTVSTPLRIDSVQTSDSVKSADWPFPNWNTL